MTNSEILEKLISNTHVLNWEASKCDDNLGGYKYRNNGMILRIRKEGVFEKWIENETYQILEINEKFKDYYNIIERYKLSRIIPIISIEKPKEVITSIKEKSKSNMKLIKTIFMVGLVFEVLKYLPQFIEILLNHLK